MDRTENSLSGICKSAEEADNVECGQRIEAGGGLVQEKQQLWFTCQFHCNGESFALLPPG